MKIFLSYASEQRELAKEIALALEAENHTVFFDRSALAPGEAYNAQIREAIEDSQLFVFLISSDSVTAGRYTLTELEFAEHKWPKPWGNVLSVMALSTPKANIPAYLRAGTIIQPSGNIAATVAAEVHRMLGPGWRRLVQRYGTRLLVLLLLIVFAAGAAWWGFESYRKIRVERAALVVCLVRQRSNRIAGIMWRPGSSWNRPGRWHLKIPRSVKTKRSWPWHG